MTDKSIVVVIPKLGKGIKPMPDDLMKANIELVCNAIPPEDFEALPIATRMTGIFGCAITNHTVNAAEFQYYLQLTDQEVKNVIECQVKGEVQVVTEKIVLIEADETEINDYLNLFSLFCGWLEVVQGKVIFKSEIISRNLSKEISTAIMQPEKNESHLLQLEYHLEQELSERDRSPLIATAILFWVEIDCEKMVKAIVSDKLAVQLIMKQVFGKDPFEFPKLTPLFSGLSMENRHLIQMQPTPMGTLFQIAMLMLKRECNKLKQLRKNLETHESEQGLTMLKKLVVSKNSKGLFTSKGTYEKDIDDKVQDVISESRKRIQDALTAIKENIYLVTYSIRDLVLIGDQLLQIENLSKMKGTRLLYSEIVLKLIENAKDAVKIVSDHVEVGSFNEEQRIEGEITNRLTEINELISKVEIRLDDIMEE